MFLLMVCLLLYNVKTLNGCLGRCNLLDVHHTLAELGIGLRVEPRRSVCLLLAHNALL